jgi:MFS family permease
MAHKQELGLLYIGITAVVALGQFVFVVDFNAANVALPSIEKSLNTPPALLSWVMSSYFLSYAGLLVLAGKIGDVYGRRLPCIIGFCCFGAGSLASFFSPNFTLLVSARTVEGIGCALMIPTTFSLINVVLPEGRLRHRAFSVYGAAQGLALLLGLTVGGAITTLFGWRSVFLLNLPLVIVGLILTCKFVPARQAGCEPAQLDIGGAALVTAAIALTLFALSETGRKGLSYEAVLGLAGAAAIFVAFARLETRLTSPLLPFSIFSYANLAGANLAGIASAAATGSVLILLNLFMQQTMRFTAMRSGLAMVPFGLSMMITGNLVGYAMARLSLRVIILAGCVGMVIGAAMLSMGASSPNYIVGVVPGTIIFAVGQTAANNTLMALSTRAVPELSQGLATGVLMTCQQIGLAIGVSVGLTVLNLGVLAGLPSTKAFERSFISGVLMSVLCIMLVVSLTRGQPK